MQKDSPIQIDLVKLFFACLRRWWLIVIFGVVFAAGAWLYSAKFITPLYRTGVTIYVNNTSSGERIDTISSGQMTASQQLVRTYVNIITSDRVLEEVTRTANLDYSADALRNLMTTEQINNTEVFKVYITHPVPEDAAFIANAIADVAPGAIEEIVEGSSTKIIDYAKVPENRFSPDIRKNTMLGGFIGIVLSVLLLSVAFLTDVRIREEADITGVTKYPILGNIPDFTQLGSTHAGRYGYGYESSKQGKTKTKTRGKEK